jgi:hypothetical protein
MRHAFPLMRVAVSKLPSPANRALRAALKRLGWTAGPSAPPQLEDRTTYNTLSTRFSQLKPIHIYRMPETAPKNGLKNFRAHRFARLAVLATFFAGLF